MKKEIIVSEKVPAAIGPYSPALKVGNFIFASGQLPIDPKTGKIVEENIEAQTRMSLENLKAVLESYSIGMENVVKQLILIILLFSMAMPPQYHGISCIVCLLLIYSQHFQTLSFFKIFPDFLPVISPLFTAISPFTITYFIPSGY